MKRIFSLYGCWIWSLATLFFCYELFLRAFVASISFDLMRDIPLTTEAFAMIGAAYYVTYTGMQIPVGILVDRFGVRLLLTFAAALSTAGAFAFAFAHHMIAALVAELVIGFASSFAFVSLLVISTNWFAQKHFGFLSGLVQLLGSLGPILAGAPFVLLVHYVDSWRIALSCVAGSGILLTLFLGIFVRNQPKDHHKRLVMLNPKEPILRKILDLFKHKQVWVIGIYTAAIFTPITLFGALWGPAFLRTKGIDDITAAFISSMVWVGISIGSPLLGKISDLYKRRKSCLILSAVIGILGTGAALYCHLYNTILLSISFLMIGLGGSGQSLAFPTITEHVIKKYRGVVMGINNTACMILGIFTPSLVSYIVHVISGFYGGALTEQAFIGGLSVVFVLYLIAFLVACFGIKETFGRQQEIVFLSFTQ